MSPLPVRDAVSAGGVVYRRVGSRIEVVVVARPREQLWALPKGTPQRGESLAQTALREVSEETGLRVELALPEPVASITYWYTTGGRDAARVHKAVHHYLMRPVGGDVANHDHEYDVVDWFELGAALKQLTFPNERRALREAALRIEVIEGMTTKEASREGTRR